jgi:hypothetical protein
LAPQKPAKHIAEGRLDNSDSKSAQWAVTGLLPTSGWRGPLRRTEPFLVAQGSSGVGLLRHRPLPAQPKALSASRNEPPVCPCMILAGNSLSGRQVWRCYVGNVANGHPRPPGAKMLTASRGEAVRCTRTKTVCGTSRIRTPIQPRAPRRRFFSWRGETDARLG